MDTNTRIDFFQFLFEIYKYSTQVQQSSVVFVFVCVSWILLWFRIQPVETDVKDCFKYAGCRMHQSWRFSGPHVFSFLWYQVSRKKDKQKFWGHSFRDPQKKGRDFYQQIQPSDAALRILEWSSSPEAEKMRCLDFDHDFPYWGNDFFPNLSWVKQVVFSRIWIEQKPPKSTDIHPSKGCKMVVFVGLLEPTDRDRVVMWRDRRHNLNVGVLGLGYPQIVLERFQDLLGKYLQSIYIYNYIYLESGMNIDRFVQIMECLIILPSFIITVGSYVLRWWKMSEISYVQKSDGHCTWHV